MINLHRYPQLLALFLISGWLANPAVAQIQPNVIVIVADDAGYADFEFMNGLSGENSVVPTPNLLALANRGVTLSRAYVAQSCQPTRAALVTGGYQNRIGNEVVGDNIQGLPGNATTIFDRMKGQGYQTAAVGKWHLGSIDGQNRPQDTGVDDFFGIWHGSRTYNLGNNGLPATQLLRETTVAANGTVTDTVRENDFSGQYFTNAMGNYAVDYITDKHDDADPFFLYQSFTAPHTPLQNSPDFNDTRLDGLSGIQKTYASMMLTMDKEIGRMMDRLDDPNGDGNTADSIRDNTLIVFVNDNGGADITSSSPNGADNGFLRDGKGSSFEGGIRVPMIIAGAGVTAAPGSVYSQNVHGVDVLSTAVGAAGANVGVGDAGLDGVNLLPFINGDNGAAAPHEVLINRHRKQFAVIKGDLRLVNNGGSNTNNHQLYNVDTDVGQTNNIANANPELVAELQRDLTDHEVTFDKPRYAILGTTAEDTINTFDHFVHQPVAPTGTVEQNIINGETGNGDFEKNSGTTLSFSQVDNWFNLEGAESVNFGTSQGTLGSPQPGSQGAFLVGNAAGNDTGYLIGDAGEVFDIALALHKFGANANYNGDEFVNAFLFTSSAAIDANTGLPAGVDILATTSFQVSGTWTDEEAAAFYTSVAGDVGKTVYLGLDLVNPTTPNPEPRIDVVQLSVNKASSGVSSSNWSDNGGWLEAGTPNVETMFNSDAFAGAVLEFGTTDTFSYVSNNDMVRETGLEFMLNKLVLSGSFSGADDQNATIAGNELLLVNNLSGDGAEIAVDATSSSDASYTYNLDTELLLYNDLAITGDGNINVNVNGQIRDYSASRGVTKRGTSTVTLTGNNTYTGDTIIEEGTLALSGAGSISQSGLVQVQAGSTLDVTGLADGELMLTLGQTLGGSGDVAGTIVALDGSIITPGTSPGILNINGDLRLEAGSSLIIELAGETLGTQYDQLNVDGAIQAGGSLLVLLDDGFVLDNDQEYSFDILNFTSLDGFFGSIVLPTFSNGRMWDQSALLSSGVLTLSAATVPEPGSVALLALGALGLAGSRRRRVLK